MLFTDIVGLVEKSEATTQIIGEVTKDGMGKVFQTNVFSHYIMVSAYTIIKKKKKHSYL